MARKVSDPHAEQQELLDCYAEPLNVVLAPNGEVRLIRESEWDAAKGRQIQRLTVSPDDRSILQTEWLINWDNAELALGNARLLDGQFWDTLRVAFLWHKVAYHARVLVEAGWVVRRSQGGVSPCKLTKARAGFPAMAADNYLPAWVPATRKVDEPFLPSLSPTVASGDVRWTLQFAGGDSVPALATADWSDDVGFAVLIDRATGDNRDVLPVEFALAHPDRVVKYKRERAFYAALERVSAALVKDRVNLTAARYLLETSPYASSHISRQWLPPTLASDNREIVVGLHVLGNPDEPFDRWLSENIGRRKRVQLVQIKRAGGGGIFRYLVGDNVPASLNGLLLAQYFTWSAWSPKPKLRDSVDATLSGDIIELYDMNTGAWRRIQTPTIETILSDSIVAR